MSALAAFAAAGLPGRTTSSSAGVVEKLVTQASPNVTYGGSIYDSALMPHSPSRHGSVSFAAYGPDDPTCSRLIFTEVRAVVGGFGVSSSSFKPGAGTYRWIAGYSGDGTHPPAAGACNDPNESVVVSKADQSITFGPLAGKTYGAAPFIVSATATSLLTVSFQSLTMSVCTVSDSVVTIVAAGVCTIGADQPGNVNFNAAFQVTQSFSVVKANQTIAFAALRDRALSGSPFTVAAAATSSLPVAFASSTPLVCTVSGNTVTLLALGTCTIAASQSGNGNYNAAAAVPQSFAVTGCPTLVFAPESLPTALEGVPFSHTIALSGGVLPATFGLAGALPPGLTFDSGTISGTPSGKGVFPVTVTAADADSCPGSASYAITVSPQRVFIAGTGSGNAPLVRAITPDGVVINSFNAYAPGFTGGVSVAQGDVNGDGVMDIITGTGPGGGPHVIAYSGATGATLASFFAFTPSFGGGVEVATGDVTGDGIPEILVAPGCGGPFVVRAFNGMSGALVREYAAGMPGGSCGLHVAAGDVTGDGLADIVLGSGGTGSPFVVVIDGGSGATVRQFLAYSAGFTGGVYVAAGDLTGDGFADIVTGAGAGGGPHVKVYGGVTGHLIAGPLASFFAYGAAFSGGVRVAAGDLNGDGRAELITAAGPGGGPHVRVFSGVNGAELLGVFAFDPSSTAGVFVGAPAPMARMAIAVLPGATASSIRVTGWALKQIGIDTVGTDAIHAWAYPVGGGVPIFVGAALDRVARPDVANLFGGEFLMSGFDFTGTLAPGTYDLVVFARNSRTLIFDQLRIVRITVN